MATQVTISNKWYACRSPLSQATALTAILEEEGFGPVNLKPTLKYLQENFTNVDRHGCENIATKMRVPDKFRHVMVIPRRRLLMRQYMTIGRIAAKITLFRYKVLRGDKDSPKDDCRRFRSCSKLLAKIVRQSGVRLENHLIIGGHGEEINKYAVDERLLYKRMQPDVRTKSALDQLKKIQPDGDLIVVPFYIPDEPVNITTKSVREGFSRGEFGLNSWMLGYSLCAQIGNYDLRENGPFIPEKNDLEVSCPGDVYTLPEPKVKKDCTTIFSWKDSALQIDLLPVNATIPHRPAIGFIPTEWR